VAAEIRHPEASPLTEKDKQQLKRALAEELPLARPLTRPQGVFATIGPGTLPQIQPTPAVTSPRYLSRDLTMSATFHTEAVVVETSGYSGFEAFLALIQRALTARLGVGALDGVERLGLRYIDEIRVPSVGDSSSWSDWIHQGLLGPTQLAGELELSNDVWQGISTYSGKLDGGPNFDRMSLVLRYGVGEGYAVSPDGDLRRKTPAPGPFFLIDIDSYWGPASTGVPMLDVDSVSRALEALHRPVRLLFETSITDRLRNEVLRRDGK
jgi:uncharacterized protein (TIGR04255 family)